MSYQSGYYGGGFGFFMTPMVKRLMLITFIAFIFQLLLELALGPPQTVNDPIFWFALVPAKVITGFLWQPLTYIFMHGGFGHIFFNMLGLFFFGPSLEDHRGSQWFLRFYLTTGIGAGIVIAIFGLFHNPYQPTIGASGSIFGVLAAFAFFWPLRPIYIWGILPVPAIILVGLYGFISITSIGDGSGVSHIGHSAGLIIALIYLFITEKTDWMLLLRHKYNNFKRQKARKKANIRVVPPIDDDDDDEDEDDDDHNDKQRMDQLLEKVARKGIDSLTQKEREFLDSISRKM